MRMTVAGQLLFPNLHRYLRDSLPKCANISKIVNNLAGYGNMKIAEVQEALRWGAGPYVVGVPDSSVSNRRCTNGAGHLKCAFAPSHPDTLEITTEEIEDFEKGLGLGRTPAGHDVPIVGVAVLHAMCHWGNYRNGVKEIDERGLKFELATYGGIIG